MIGTKGVLKMDPGYAMSSDIKCEIVVGEKTRKQIFKKRDQFGPELVYFSDCILNDKEPEPNGEEGLRDVVIIEALQQSARNGKPVALPSAPATTHPSLRQELHKPAIEEPDMASAPPRLRANAFPARALVVAPCPTFAARKHRDHAGALRNRRTRVSPPRI